MYSCVGKFHEQIKFELRNISKKLKVRYFEEDKTLCSRNLKIHCLDVIFQRNLVIEKWTNKTSFINV